MVKRKIKQTPAQKQRRVKKRMERRAGVAAKALREHVPSCDTTTLTACDVAALEALGWDENGDFVGTD